VSERLARFLARGPIVLDAGLGTRLIAQGLDLARDDPVFWNLARFDAVLALHRRDRAAGADGVVTNTFGANRAWLARWGRQRDVGPINRRAAQLAREAVGPSGLVVGSVGPTAASDPDAVREQAAALTDAGVDALLCETHRYDQATASLRALHGHAPVPILVSLVAWPEPVRDAARRLADLGAAVLGVNCQLGMAAALAAIETLSGATELPLLAKPGIGTPGDAPAVFAAAVPRLRARGVRLVGGCCGTTEAHVAALHAACYHQPAPVHPTDGATATGAHA
jgi:methionine synthase I (cobalamin-dependent)